MQNKYKVAFMLLSTLSAPAIAEKSGVSFTHKDWEVVCDNTLTCRAAGYGQENETGGSDGSVLLTREAGPGTEITGDVVLADIEDDDDDDTPSPPLTLWINNQSAGNLSMTNEGDWRLSTSQTQALIAAIKGSGSVEFKGGTRSFVLSGDGAYAAMLKMDDVQGRIGTVGALSKKGDKPESSVLAAIPAPVIQAVKIDKAQIRPLTAPELAALEPKLRATLNQDNVCDRLQPSEDHDERSDEGITVTPLDDKHALLSTLCWRAAYNEGYGYWVIDKALQENPVLVTDSGTDYSDGTISMGQKGRGLGDCWATASWVWDGQSCRKSSESSTGMCRYIRLGGTWDLPTFVADVKPAQ